MGAFFGLFKGFSGNQSAKSAPPARKPSRHRGQLAIERLESRINPSFSNLTTIAQSMQLGEAALPQVPGLDASVGQMPPSRLSDIVGLNAYGNGFSSSNGSGWSQFDTQYPTPTVSDLQAVANTVTTGLPSGISAMVIPTNNGTTISAGKALASSTIFPVYGSLPDLKLAQYTGGFTVQAWFNSSNISDSWQRIIDLGNGASSDNIIVGITGSQLFMSTYNGSSGNNFVAGQALSSNTWYQVTAVFGGGSTGTGSLYLNGVLQGSTSALATVNNIARSNNYWGKSNWSSDPAWQGQQDELRFWNRQLSATEIAANYNVQLASNQNGLLAYYQANQGSNTNGTSLLDSSGNGETATLEYPANYGPATSSFPVGTTTDGYYNQVYINARYSYTSELQPLSVNFYSAKNLCHVTPLLFTLDNGVYTLVASSTAILETSGFNTANLNWSGSSGAFTFVAGINYYVGFKDGQGISDSSGNNGSIEWGTNSPYDNQWLYTDTGTNSTFTGNLTFPALGLGNTFSTTPGVAWASYLNGGTRNYSFNVVATGQVNPTLTNGPKVSNFPLGTYTDNDYAQVYINSLYSYTSANQPVAVNFYSASSGHYITPLLFTLNNGNYTLVASAQYPWAYDPDGVGISVSQGNNSASLNWYVNTAPFTFAANTNYYVGFSDRNGISDGTGYDGCIEWSINSPSNNQWLFTDSGNNNQSGVPTLGSMNWGSTFSNSSLASNFYLNGGYRNYSFNVLSSSQPNPNSTLASTVNQSGVQIQWAEAASTYNAVFSTNGLDGGLHLSKSGVSYIPVTVSAGVNLTFGLDASGNLQTGINAKWSASASYSSTLNLGIGLGFLDSSIQNGSYSLSTTVYASLFDTNTNTSVAGANSAGMVTGTLGETSDFSVASASQFVQSSGTILVNASMPFTGQVGGQAFTSTPTLALPTQSASVSTVGYTQPLWTLSNFGNYLALAQLDAAALVSSGLNNAGGSLTSIGQTNWQQVPFSTSTVNYNWGDGLNNTAGLLYQNKLSIAGRSRILGGLPTNNYGATFSITRGTGSSATVSTVNLAGNLASAASSIDTISPLIAAPIAYYLSSQLAGSGLGCREQPNHPGYLEFYATDSTITAFQMSPYNTSTAYPIGSISANAFSPLGFFSQPVTSSALMNGSFEGPYVAPGSSIENPANAQWTFSGPSGIAANGSPCYGPDAPNGKQALYAQQSSTCSQTLLEVPGGSYQLSFLAIQGSGSGVSANPATVTITPVGGVSSTTILNLSASQLNANGWNPFTSGSFTLPAGNYTLTFTFTGGSGSTTCIDDIQLKTYTLNARQATYPAALSYQGLLDAINQPNLIPSTAANSPTSPPAAYPASNPAEGALYFNTGIQYTSANIPTAVQFVANVASQKQYLTPVLLSVSGGTYTAQALGNPILVYRTGLQTANLAFTNFSPASGTSYVLGFMDGNITNSSSSGATTFVSTNTGTVGLDYLSTTGTYWSVNPSSLTLGASQFTSSNANATKRLYSFSAYRGLAQAGQGSVARPNLDTSSNNSYVYTGASYTTAFVPSKIRYYTNLTAAQLAVSSPPKITPMLFTSQGGGNYTVAAVGNPVTPTANGLNEADVVFPTLGSLKPGTSYLFGFQNSSTGVVAVMSGASTYGGWVTSTTSGLARGSSANFSAAGIYSLDIIASQTTGNPASGSGTSATGSYGQVVINPSVAYTGGNNGLVLPSAMQVYATVPSGGSGWITPLLFQQSGSGSTATFKLVAAGVSQEVTNNGANQLPVEFPSAVIAGLSTGNSYVMGYSTRQVQLGNGGAISAADSYSPGMVQYTAGSGSSAWLTSAGGSSASATSGYPALTVGSSVFSQGGSQSASVLTSGNAYACTFLTDATQYQAYSWLGSVQYNANASGSNGRQVLFSYADISNGSAGVNLSASGINTVSVPNVNNLNLTGSANVQTAVSATRQFSLMLDANIMTNGATASNRQQQANASPQVTNVLTSINTTPSTMPYGVDGFLSSITQVGSTSQVYSVAPAVTITDSLGYALNSSTAFPAYGNLPDLQLGQYAQTPSQAIIGSPTITNGGKGYNSAPMVTITDSTGTGATATATINSSGVVTGITITNGGTGYSAPVISFSGGGGTGASAQFSAANLSPAAGFTVQAWFNTSNIGSGLQRIIDLGNGPNSDNIIVGIVNSQLFMDTFNNSTGNVFAAGPKLSSNTWYHVSAVFTSGTGALYLNGKQVGTFGSMPQVRNVARANNYWGKSNWAGDPVWQGQQDELRFWNTPLTPAQIQANWNTTFASTQPNLIAYYKTDKTYGTTSDDSSGFGNLANLSSQVSGLSIANGNASISSASVPVPYTPAQVTIVAPGLYYLTGTAATSSGSQAVPLVVLVDGVPLTTISSSLQNGSGYSFTSSGLQLTPGVHTISFVPQGATAGSSTLSGLTLNFRPLVKSTAPLPLIGQGATAVANLNPNTGTLASISLTNPGSGYANPVVTVQGNSVATAVAKLGAGSNAGKVQSLKVVSGGKYYASAPFVTISDSNGGTGTGASATAILTNGVVTGFTITNPGSNYKNPVVTISAPTVAIATREIIIPVPNVAISDPSGTGAFATVQLNSSGTLSSIAVGANTATATANLSGGTIGSLNLTGPGQFYTSAPVVTITDSNGGAGSGATATASVTTGMIIATPTITNAGSGYSVSPSVKITDPTGTGAVAFASVYNDGTLKSIVIANPGSGYTNPVFTLSAPGGSGTTAMLSYTGVSNYLGGKVTGLTVTGSGTGYSAPVVTIAPPATANAGYVSPTITLPHNSDYAATATVVMNTNGTINKIVVSSGGTGYSSPPAVTISGGGGNGAQAVATVTNGVVTGITVTNPGSGYTSPPTITLGSPNQQATAAAVAGRIQSIKVPAGAGGSGYLSAPAVTISDPNGTGATATATITNGVVTAITVTNPGSGYVNPTISIAPPASAPASAGLNLGSIGKISVSATGTGTGYTSPPTVSIVDNPINQVSIPITNNSFETPSLGNGAYTYLGTASGASQNGWTWFNGGSSFGGSGIAANGSQWYGPNANIDGTSFSQAAFLQGVSSISQTLNITNSGYYYISLWAVGNSNLPANAIQILVDGVAQNINLSNTTVGSTIPASALNSGNWQYFYTFSFPLSSGSHTISFNGLGNNGANVSSAIDAIGLYQVGNGMGRGATATAVISTGGTNGPATETFPVGTSYDETYDAVFINALYPYTSVNPPVTVNFYADVFSNFITPLLFTLKNGVYTLVASTQFGIGTSPGTNHVYLNWYANSVPFIFEDNINYYVGFKNGNGISDPSGYDGCIPYSPNGTISNQWLFTGSLSTSNGFSDLVIGNTFSGSGNSTFTFTSGQPNRNYSFNVTNYTSVTGVTTTNPGSGYSNPVVTIAGGGGYGAVASASLTFSSTTTNTVTIYNGGYGYFTAPSVQILDSKGGTGSGVTATATINNSGVVTAITLAGSPSAFSSYTAPVLVISAPTGTTATATATVDSTVSLTGTAGGSGYTTAPKVTIVDSKGGTGTGATATATVVNNVVTGITITNPGYGYSNPVITLSAPTGTTAQASAANWSVQLTNGGQFYSQPPVVTVSPANNNTFGPATSTFPVGTTTDAATAQVFINALYPYTSVNQPASVNFYSAFSGHYITPLLFTLNNGVYTLVASSTPIGVSSGNNTASLNWSGSSGAFSFAANLNYYVGFSDRNGLSDATGYDGCIEWTSNSPTSNQWLFTDDNLGSLSIGKTFSGSGSANYSFYNGEPYRNYSFNVTSSLIEPGPGSGATATATLENGVVTGITINNAGSGYIAPPIITIANPFTATAVLSQGVMDAEVTYAGTLYQTPPTVTITDASGNGTGATGYAVLVGGQVSDIVITNYGTGYISPVVTLSAPTVDISQVPTGPSAVTHTFYFLDGSSWSTTTTSDSGISIQYQLIDQLTQLADAAAKGLTGGNGSTAANYYNLQAYLTPLLSSTAPTYAQTGNLGIIFPSTPNSNSTNTALSPLLWNMSAGGGDPIVTQALFASGQWNMATVGAVALGNIDLVMNLSGNSGSPAFTGTAQIGYLDVNLTAEDFSPDIDFTLDTTPGTFLSFGNWQGILGSDSALAQYATTTSTINSYDLTLAAQVSSNVAKLLNLPTSGSTMPEVTFTASGGNGVYTGSFSDANWGASEGMLYISQANIGTAFEQIATALAYTDTSSYLGATLPFVNGTLQDLTGFSDYFVNYLEDELVSGAPTDLDSLIDWVNDNSSTFTLAFGSVSVGSTSGQGLYLTPVNWSDSVSTTSQFSFSVPTYAALAGGLPSSQNMLAYTVVPPNNAGDVTVTADVAWQAPMGVLFTQTGSGTTLGYGTQGYIAGSTAWNLSDISVQADDLDFQGTLGTQAIYFQSDTNDTANVNVSNGMIATTLGANTLASAVVTSTLGGSVNNGGYTANLPVYYPTSTCYSGNFNISGPSGGTSTASLATFLNQAALFNATLSGGAITGFTAITSGSNYLTTSAGGSAPLVLITDAAGQGTGAAATATVNSNGTISLTLTSAGSGYVSPVVTVVGGKFNPNTPTGTPSVTFTLPDIDNNDIAALSLANAISDPNSFQQGLGGLQGALQSAFTQSMAYTSQIIIGTATSQFSQAFGLYGTISDYLDQNLTPFVPVCDQNATASATASAIAGTSGGVITAITVITSGESYQVAPTVTITDLAGTGSGATATAIMVSDGNGGLKVGSITITNAGSGYAQPIVSISSPSAGNQSADDQLYNEACTVYNLVLSTTGLVLDPTQPENPGSYIPNGQTASTTGQIPLFFDAYGNQLTYNSAAQYFVNSSGIETTVQAVQFPLIANFTLENTSIPFSFGMPGIPLTINNPLDLNLIESGSTTVNLTFGIDALNGFYIVPVNPSSGTQFSGTVDAGPDSDFSSSMTLGLLSGTMTAQTGEIFTMPFSTTMNDPNYNASSLNNQLTLAEINSLNPLSLFQTTLSIPTVGLNIDMSLQVAGGGIAAALPSIGNTMSITWTPGQGAPQLSYNNFYIDLGSFISNYMGAIAPQLTPITNGIQPILNALDTQIPVLGDIIGGDTSLLGLANRFGGANLGFVQAVDAIVSMLSDVTSAVNYINANPGQSFIVPLDVVATFADDFRTAASGLSKPQQLNQLPSQAQVVSAMNSFMSQYANQVEANFTAPASRVVNQSYGVSGGLGISFDILDPVNIIGLITGQTVDLFHINFPELYANFSIDESFPLDPPLYMTFGGGVNASINLSLGMDSAGLEQWLAATVTGTQALSVAALEGLAQDILYQGFFVDGAGTDISANGYLSLGVQLNAGIAQAGVNGDFNIGMTMTPNVDSSGRLDLQEMIQLAGADFSSPQNLFDFDLTGSISANAYLDIFLPFSWQQVWSHNFGSYTLFNIENNPTPPTEQAASYGSLYLNMGATAGRRSKTNAITDEHFEIRHLAGVAGNESLSVQFYVAGVPQYLDAQGNPKPQVYHNIDKVVGIAGLGDDIIDCTGVLSPTHLEGGGGRDTLIGGLGRNYLDGGNGPDQITGGPLADTILGGDGFDLINGGGGADSIDGGKGDDTIDHPEGGLVIPFGDRFGSDVLTQTALAGSTLDFSNVTQNLKVTLGTVSTIQIGNKHTISWTGAGPAKIILGKGDDTILFTKGYSSLVIDSGAGRDRFEIFDFENGQTVAIDAAGNKPDNTFLVKTGSIGEVVADQTGVHSGDARFNIDWTDVRKLTLHETGAKIDLDFANSGVTKILAFGNEVDLTSGLKIQDVRLEAASLVSVQADIIAAKGGEVALVAGANGAVKIGTSGDAKLSTFNGNIEVEAPVAYLGGKASTVTTTHTNGKFRIEADQTIRTATAPTPFFNTSVPSITVGQGGSLRAWSTNGTALTAPLTPFQGYQGVPRFNSVSDLDGDGIADLVSVPQPGVSPHMVVFSGKDMSVLRSVYVFDPRFLGGVNVATGDVNGDGLADILLAADAGATPHVVVISGGTWEVLASFYAFDKAFHGGLRLAAADANGDGVLDIITSTASGPISHVVAFANLGQSVITSFYAFPEAVRNGVEIAAADLDGDNIAELILGTTGGTNNQVGIYRGNPSAIDYFMAYQGWNGDVRVGSVKTPGKTLITTGPGQGAGPNVRTFDPDTYDLLDSFFAGNPGDLSGITL